MKRTFTKVSVIFLLVMFNAINAYADIVLPAIANQFAVSFALNGEGWGCSIIIGILILIVEAFFIKKLLFLSFSSAFGYSFAINLASSFVGILITSFAFSGKNIFAYGNMRFGTYLGMIPGYVFTVLIEGLLLILCSALLKRSNKVSECFKTSVIMNFCSYLILLVSLIVADFLTKGQNFHVG